MQINQISDAEHSRYKLNKTNSQKKNADATKEGVVVNSFVKENTAVDMNDTYNTMIISDDAKMPKKLKENKNNNKQRNSLTPMILSSLGVMSAVTLMTFLAKDSAKTKVFINRYHPEKALESVTRIITVNEEKNQAWYQMVQCPNRKTILAGSGVFVLSAMAFIGKMFIDGFKDVWVKKREADIQKDLQENLISVETQAFSGKVQIIRGMLAKKAKEFGEYLHTQPEQYPTFKNMMSWQKTKFMGKEEGSNNSNLKYIASGILTLGSIVGLGFLAIKNLRNGKVHMEESIKHSEKLLENIIKTSTEKTVKDDYKTVKEILISKDANAKEIKETIKALPIPDNEKEKYIEDAVFDITKSVVKIEKNLGGNGNPKSSISSFTDDYKAFFYTWLMEKDNKLFRNLFYGMTTIAAVSYGGQVLGEGLKDVEVKKMNAETELGLQKRLVATELRNFKSKKDAAINPLMEEFYKQVKNGKSKEELKVMADNILFEVKNGPPFVYS